MNLTCRSTLCKRELLKQQLGGIDLLIIQTWRKKIQEMRTEDIYIVFPLMSGEPCKILKGPWLSRRNTIFVELVCL